MSTTDTLAVRPIGEPELLGLLGQVERRREGARLLLVAATPSWDGPEVIESHIGPVRVVLGRSPLAVRIAMVDHPDEFLAVLTRLSATELGEEVAARAWRGSVRRPSPWDAVTSLFKVLQVDPSLHDEKWMVDLLVRLAPPGGYPQPASQILDRATAWRTLYRHGLGLPTGSITPADLLRWAASDTADAALDKLDDESRRNVAARLAVDVGPAAEPLLDLAAAGAGSELVALGLVMDALWPGPDPVARALLQERYLQRRPISEPAAADWASAALEVVLAADAGVDGRAAWLQRAETILTEVDPEDTGDSGLLERGFLKRLAAFGEAISVGLSNANGQVLRTVRQAFERVCFHQLARRSPARMAAAEAAFRLVRRQLTGSPPVIEGDLGAQTRTYIEDGGWVDACRHQLATGETVPQLSAAYDTLLRSIDDERRSRDRAYARRVAEEGTSPVGSGSLESVRPLRIEQVLEAVVAPIARQRPVLLLVVDGLSHASAVPMVDDLRAEGWRLHGFAGRPLPGVVAALPTRTNCSRSSLLAGRLQPGGQRVEREGFTGYEPLIEAADGQAPVLFHKSDLKVDEGEVAAEPRAAISDPEQRVVGVVVNGVDDFLASGGQVRLAEGLDGVPLMRQLLDAALEAGRCVIITSDHGHILGSHQRVVAHEEGSGERFRVYRGQEPDEGEVLLEGGRVLVGNGTILAGADDGVRHTAAAKHGYHGGASPAEVLCPLLVLCSQQDTLEGWEALPPYAPAWWDPKLAPVDIDLDLDVRAPAAPPARAPATPKAPQPSLFEPETSSEPEGVAASSHRALPAWLTTLLASSRLADQRRLAGRATLDDDDLALLIRVLLASGGTASGATLQRTLGVPATRLRGKLEAARTLLDVDGYAVLKIEADGTAVLNRDLLAQQFELDRSALGEKESE